MKIMTQYWRSEIKSLFVDHKSMTGNITELMAQQIENVNEIDDSDEILAKQINGIEFMKRKTKEEG